MRLPAIISNEEVRDAFERHFNLTVNEVFEGRAKWNARVTNGKRHVVISWPFDEPEPFIPHQIVFDGESRKYKVDWPNKLVRCNICMHHHRLREPHVVPENDTPPENQNQNEGSQGDLAVVEGNSEETPEANPDQSAEGDKEIPPSVEAEKQTKPDDGLESGEISVESGELDESGMEISDNETQQKPENNEPVLFERSKSTQDLEKFIDLEFDNKVKKKAKKKRDKPPNITEEIMST